MTRARDLANLSNTDILAVDSSNQRVGIGTTSPDYQLHVVGSGTTTLFVDGDSSITGILTATSFVKQGGTSSQFLKADGSSDSSSYITSIGISSSGTSIGNATTLNFIGAGNTFAVNGNTIDVSIQGGGGAGVSSTGILTCRGFANSSLITESIMMDDFYNEGTNYGMVGPIEVSIGATITVGLGVSYAIL